MHEFKGLNVDRSITRSWDLRRKAFVLEGVFHLFLDFNLYCADWGANDLQLFCLGLCNAPSH